MPGAASLLTFGLEREKTLAHGVRARSTCALNARRMALLWMRPLLRP